MTQPADPQDQLRERLARTTLQLRDAHKQRAATETTIDEVIVKLESQNSGAVADREEEQMRRVLQKASENMKRFSQAVEHFEVLEQALKKTIQMIEYERSFDAGPWC